MLTACPAPVVASWQSADIMAAFAALGETAQESMALSAQYARLGVARWVRRTGASPEESARAVAFCDALGRGDAREAHRLAEVLA